MQPQEALDVRADVPAVLRRRGAETVLEHSLLAQDPDPGREGIGGRHQHAPLGQPGTALVLDDRDDVTLSGLCGACEDAARLPEEQVELVEVVNHEIDGRAAGLDRIADPVRPVGGEGEPVRGDLPHGADLSRGDAPLDLRVLGEETQHEPDHERPPALLGRRENRLPVLDGEGDRLLEQHVLSGGERSLGDLAVHGRRQADVDGVDLRVGEDSVQIGREPCAYRIGYLLRPLRRSRAHRLDSRPAGCDAEPAGVRRAHEPGAEYRQGDHQCSFRKSCCLALNSSGISQNGA